MYDQARWWWPLDDGNLQGGADQFRRYVGHHGPTDDFARIQIQYHRQIQPAAQGSNIRDVRDPGRVGLSLLKLTSSTFSYTGRLWLLSVVWTVGAGRKLTNRTG